VSANAKYWDPLWPKLEATITAKQPSGKLPRANQDGWIGTIHSPLREDKHASFSLKPDSETDPGAWKDHGTGEGGSMADLARRLGVLPFTGPQAVEPPRVQSFEEFCAERHLDADRLKRDWHVRPWLKDSRPGLLFPAGGSYRIKFLDGRKPKCTWKTTGGALCYGLNRAKAHGGDVLYIVNGEPSVWAAQQEGVPAICFCAGEGTAPTAEIAEELRQSGFLEFVVVYDLDDAGRAGAQRVVEALRAGDLSARALQLPADLGVGGDVDDLHRRVGDGLRDALAALPDLDPEPPRPAATPRLVKPTEDAAPWQDRQPLPPETLVVPTFPPELLPDALRSWLVDVARRASIPLEFVTVPALVALGVVVGRQLGIRPERFDSFTVVPNLWGGIVARPGMLKSHALKEGLEPLQPLIKAASEEYQSRRLAMDAKKRAFELELEAMKRVARGAGAGKPTPGEIQALMAEIERCRVVERRYMTQDATTEKLGELLRDNPRGILLARDELAGWLLTMDKPGREGEREFYLEAWNGTDGFTCDRIGRGTIHIPAMCLSVVGTIQPDKLRPYVAQAVGHGSGADGLLQRLQLLVWPDEIGDYQRVTHLPDAGARERAFSMYAALDGLRPVDASDAGGGPVPFVQFAEDAQELWDTWRDELERRLRSHEFDRTPALEAHLAKYRSLMPSLALLSHLADVMSSGTTSADIQPVSLKAAQLGAAWCEFLEQHARKLYGSELQPAVAAARKLAAKIEEQEIKHGQAVRDIYRPQWEGLRTSEAVRAGLGVLESHNWVRVITQVTGGRTTDVVELHPGLRS
jgi:putative DNA primase/helicase